MSPKVSDNLGAQLSHFRRRHTGGTYAVKCCRCLSLFAAFGLCYYGTFPLSIFLFEQGANYSGGCLRYRGLFVTAFA